MKRPSSYKLTFFDKHGAEGSLRIKAFSYALMTLALVVAASLLAGAPLTVTLMLAIPLSLFTGYGSFYLGKKAGDVMEYVTAGGSSTPYEEQFSRQQALVMQQKYGDALALFEEQIARTSGEPRVRIAAADLYVQHGQDPYRAAELYREVQRLPKLAAGHDIYVTNKLADLFLGPLKEPGRALVEFRKLTARYPGTPAARNAELAIRNLKPRIVHGTEAPPPDVWERPTIDRRDEAPPNTPGMPGY